MAKDTFLEAVATISAEDEGLRRAMKDNETVVKTSVNKMQGDLNRLNTTVGTTGTQAASAGQYFSLFGASMSTAGGTAGMVGGKVAALGGAMASLSTGTFTLVGGVGLAVAALAALAVTTIRVAEAMAGVTAEESALTRGLRRLTDWWEGVAEAQERSAKQTSRLKLQEEGIAITVEKLRQQHLILLGHKASEFEQNIKIKGAMQAIEQTQGRIKQAVEREAESRRLLVQRLTEEKRLSEEKLRIEERATQELKNQEAARSARVMGGGVRTREEGRERVWEAVKSIEGGMKNLFYVHTELQAMVKQYPERIGRFSERLLKHFGWDMPDAVADPARGGGISPYAFAGGIPQAGGGRDRTDHRIRLEEKRTTDIERVADATERMERNRDSGGAL